MEIEWFAPGSRGFELRTFIPAWCRELHWSVDPPNAGHRINAFVSEGGLATLVYLLRRRLRPLRAWSAAVWRSLLLRFATVRTDGVTRDSRGYARHLRRVEPSAAELEGDIARHIARIERRASLVVVCRVLEGEQAAAVRSARSLIEQQWPDWTLHLVFNGKSMPEAFRDLGGDARIRMHADPADEGLAGGLPLPSAGLLGFLQPGDLLHPLALYVIAASLDQDPGVDLIYCDEDRIDATGRRHAPAFKPGWNPEWFDAEDYLGNLILLAADRLAEGAMREVWRRGEARHRRLLAITGELDPRRIRHLPWVLCHCPPQAGRSAADPHRIESAAPAAPAARPLASIIVPTRDGGAHLEACIGSLRDRTQEGWPYELILVDNQSRDPRTLGYLEQLRQRADARVIEYDAPFNFAAIVNRAAEEARGEVLVLLNDDTEIRSPDWLAVLMRLAMRRDVGAVGAKLLYPDGTLQHGGLGLGIGGVAAHLHLGVPGDAPGYLGMLRVERAVGAVTGACMAVARDKFRAVGGMNEQALKVALNDVDLCLRLTSRGWRSVWTPRAVLVHHESRTRGHDDTPHKRARFFREHAYMRACWDRVLDTDPYYHRHLSRRALDLRFDPGARPIRPWTTATTRADVFMAVELPR